MLNRAVLAVLAILATAVAVAPSAAAAEPALAWSSPQTVSSAAIVDVDCPTSGLCVAVDADGNVHTSTDPAGPATSWSAADVIGSSLHSISCASPTLCVAVSTSGNLVTSTNPTGGAAAWTTTNVSGAAYLGAVDCTAGLCAALDANGQIVTSSDPMGGSAAWDVADVQGSGTLFLSAIDCPSAGLCVAVGSDRHNLGGGFFVQENVVATATDPTGGVGAWTESFAGFRSYMRAISCPTTSFCLVVDKEGAAWFSANPTGGEGAWSQRFIDSEEDLTDVSCPSTSLCVALDESGQVLTSTDPTGGMNAWGIASIPSGIVGLSCPTTSLCLAAGQQQVVSGTPRVPAAQDAPPRQPQSPSGSAPLLSRPSIHRQQAPLDVRGRNATMVLDCPGPSSCHGRAWLEAPFKPKRASARPKYRPIGSTRFDFTGQTVVTVALNKAGRELLATRRQARARVRISAMSSTGVPLSLTQFATLKKRD